MTTAKERLARTCTVLITAGGIEKLDEALEMAKGFQLRSVHFDQLAVPPEENGARLQMADALRVG